MDQPFEKYLKVILNDWALKISIVYRRYLQNFVTDISMQSCWFVYSFMAWQKENQRILNKICLELIKSVFYSNIL